MVHTVWQNCLWLSDGACFYSIKSYTGKNSKCPKLCGFLGRNLKNFIFLKILSIFSFFHDSFFSLGKQTTFNIFPDSGWFRKSSWIHFLFDWIKTGLFFFDQFLFFFFSLKYWYPCICRLHIGNHGWHYHYFFTM